MSIVHPSVAIYQPRSGCCQSNANQSPKCQATALSGRQLTPLGQCSRAVLLEDVAAIDVTVVVEMNMDRGMDGGEFLQGLDVPEFRHRALSSSKWLV